MEVDEKTEPVTGLIQYKNTDDPLNWSRPRKELFYFSILASTAAMGTVGPLFVPAFSIMASELDVEISAIAQLNGYAILMLGVSSYLGGIVADICGRRPFMLLTLALTLGGSLWGAVGSGYGQLVGARILQGSGMGGYASLSNVLIADVFSSADRGPRLALWQMVWIVTINITPTITASIIQHSSWRVPFIALAGYLALCGILTLCAGRESRYTRPSEEESVHVGYVPRSSLAIWHGVDLRSPLRSLLIRPLSLCSRLSVIWSILAYSWMFSVLIIAGSIYSQLFAGAPYHLDLTSIGLISGVGPLIGALMGGLGTSWTSKLLAERSKQKHGRILPETYLIYMLPASLCILAGHLGWGLAVQHNLAVVVAGVLIAIAQFGLTVGVCGVVLYLSVASAGREADAMGLVMLVRSILAFACQFFVNDWLHHQGPLSFLCTIGGSASAVCLLAIPLWAHSANKRNKRS